MSKKRKRCPVCKTTLADANPGPNCFRHTRGMKIERCIPKCLCTSYSPMEFLMNPNIPKPGDPNYNDTAFEFIYEGHVDENGNIQKQEKTGRTDEEVELAKYESECEKVLNNINSGNPYRINPNLKNRRFLDG